MPPTGRWVPTRASAKAQSLEVLYITGSYVHVRYVYADGKQRRGRLHIETLREKWRPVR